jgi:hypothetical protein
LSIALRSQAFFHSLFDAAEARAYAFCMKQLACALAALVAAATAMTLAVYGALRLLPLLETRHVWLMPACELIAVFGMILAGWKMRRAGPREDRALTPLMRMPLPTSRRVGERLPK